MFNKGGGNSYESDVHVPTGFQREGAIGDNFVRGSFGVEDAKLCGAGDNKTGVFNVE